MNPFHKFSCFLLVGSFLITENLFSESFRGGIEVVQDSGYTYAISLPINFQKNKKYLLGICLHGLFGNGRFILKDFSPYSRYMNMILACPNGNIPDPSRSATKWGSEESVDYLYNFMIYIQNKYLTYEDPFLIGFSQGANQALFLALRNPEIWKTIAVLSGGYSEIPKEYYPNAGALNILFISGDTGPGEVYTLKKMKERLEVLKPFNQIEHKIIKGHIHETSTDFAYSIFRWYISVNDKFQKNFWLNKGDYLKAFSSGELEFQSGNFEKSMIYFKKSIKMNPIYPNSVVRYCHASLLGGRIKSFKKSLFKALELHSSDPVYSRIPVSLLFEDIRITFKTDSKLREHLIHYFENRLKEYEDTLEPIFLAEIYYLLANLYQYSENMVEAKRYSEEARVIYASIEDSSLNFKELEVKKKLDLLENF